MPSVLLSSLDGFSTRDPHQDRSVESAHSLSLSLSLSLSSPSLSSPSPSRRKESAVKAMSRHLLPPSIPHGLLLRCRLHPSPTLLTSSCCTPSPLTNISPSPPFCVRFPCRALLVSFFCPSSFPPSLIIHLHSTHLSSFPNLQPLQPLVPARPSRAHAVRCSELCSVRLADDRFSLRRFSFCREEVSVFPVEWLEVAHRW